MRSARAVRRRQPVALRPARLPALFPAGRVHRLVRLAACVTTRASRRRRPPGEIPEPGRVPDARTAGVPARARGSGDSASPSTQYRIRVLYKQPAGEPPQHSDGDHRCTGHGGGKRQADRQAEAAEQAEHRDPPRRSVLGLRASTPTHWRSRSTAARRRRRNRSRRADRASRQARQPRRPPRVRRPLDSAADRRERSSAASRSRAIAKRCPRDAERRARATHPSAATAPPICAAGARPDSVPASTAARSGADVASQASSPDGQQRADADRRVDDQA